MAECQPDRDELYDLYRLAIEEYRFNVKLSWDRTRFFVGLNAVLVTAASAVMRFIDAPAILLVAIGNYIRNSRNRLDSLTAFPHRSGVNPS